MSTKFPCNIILHFTPQLCLTPVILEHTILHTNSRRVFDLALQVVPWDDKRILEVNEKTKDLNMKSAKSKFLFYSKRQRNENLVFLHLPTKASKS
jgi:hypothetical protein